MNTHSRSLQEILGTQCHSFEISDLGNDKTYSLASLEDLASTYAAELLSYGLGPNKRIILSEPNSIQFFIGLFAIWKINSIPFILDSGMTTYEFNSLHSRIRPAAALRYSKIEIDTHIPSSHLAPLPHDTAFVLFTSGTTSTPKAVVHTFDGLKSRLQVLDKAIPKSYRERSLCLLPLHFGHGLIGISILSLFSGGHLTITPAININNIGELSKWLRDAKPNFISGTPITWRMITKFVPNDVVTELKRAQVASAPAESELFEKIRDWAKCPVYNVYGMTEAASWVSDKAYKMQGDECLVGDGTNWNTKFRLVDKNSDLTGRIQLQTDGIFWGYWDSESNGVKLDENWLQTDDIGFINSDGNLKLIGRTGRVINRNGLKISPEEVELALLSESSVLDAAILSVGENENEVGALIVLDESYKGRKNIIGEIIKNLLIKVSDYKVPTQFKFTKSIPRTPNGKLNLKEIKKLWSNLL